MNPRISFRLEEKLAEFYNSDQTRRQQQGEKISPFVSSSDSTEVREKRTLRSLFLLEDELNIQLQRQTSSSKAFSFLAKLPWRKTKEKETITRSSSRKSTILSCPLACVKDNNTRLEEEEERRSPASTSIAESSSSSAPRGGMRMSRSLSEPGRGRRRTKSSTLNPRRSVSSETGDEGAVRNDGLFWKREKGFNRSRSFQVSSSTTSYVGNGLLRFHFAPLGNTRRHSSRSRGRSSYSFGPGFFSVR